MLFSFKPLLWGYCLFPIFFFQILICRLRWKWCSRNIYILIWMEITNYVSNYNQNNLCLIKVFKFSTISKLQVIKIIWLSCNNFLKEILQLEINLKKMLHPFQFASKSCYVNRITAFSETWPITDQHDRHESTVCGIHGLPVGNKIPPVIYSENCIVSWQRKKSVL